MTLFSPVGRERRRTFLRPLGAFVVGLTAGAFATATALWILGGMASALPAPAATGLLLCGVTALLLRDLGLLRLPLPENVHQVPQSVLHQPGLRPALRFGLDLGTGVRTYTPSASPYMLALAIVLVPAPWSGAAAAACGFALGRAAMPATRLLSDGTAAWDELLARRLPWLLPCAAGVSAVIAGALTFWP